MRRMRRGPLLSIDTNVCDAVRAARRPKQDRKVFVSASIGTATFPGFEGA
jgi:hypothetical protein